jgi:iron complex outermembrane recepter protein
VRLELNSTRRLGTELELHVNPVEWPTLSADSTYGDARFVGSGDPVPLAAWLVARFLAIATLSSRFHGGLRFMDFVPAAPSLSAQLGTTAVF